MNHPAPRTLEDWLHNPSYEESICVNHFHNVMYKVFTGTGGSAMDPFWSEEFVSVKVARLIKAGLVFPEGDVIYVRERDNLIPLGEAIALLAYYMHVDSKEARKAADLLENNFQGYFPITGNGVWRNGIILVHADGRETAVDMSTLTMVHDPSGHPEFGKHAVDPESYDVLHKFFHLIDDAVGEPYFFEKALMYPFNQRIREKSHVLVGQGGNGKSVFMRLVQALYGDRALTDAPQPTFKGHDPGVISYNFIGKRVVTFNDVGDPSEAFLEWLKRMITGNLEVKTPSGAWLSIPCRTNFMLETNHAPAVLDIEAHARRYVIRTFESDFRLIDHMTNDELDVIGERGHITAGDLIAYLMGACKGQVDDWTRFCLPNAPVEDNMVPLCDLAGNGLDY
jgi:hypothetical protein